MASERVESADFVRKKAETVAAMKGLAQAIAGALGRNGHLAHAKWGALDDHVVERFVIHPEDHHA
jgi:hypothetical protein